LNKNKRTVCPPVSKELIKHLTESFPDNYNISDELFQQKLVFQAGINTVIKYLEVRNKQQEGLGDVK
jgi:hypothetical protein